MVAAPTDYPWSSHHNYLGQRNEPWVTTEFALSLFHPELHLAQVAYQRFIHDPSMSTDSPLQDVNQNDRRILGNDAFAANLLGSAWRPRSHKTLDMLVDEACKKFHTSRDALTSASRSRHLTHARAWVAHQALLLRITTLTRVADLFGRTDSALRQSVKRHFNYP